MRWLLATVRERAVIIVSGVSLVTTAINVMDVIGVQSNL